MSVFFLILISFFKVLVEDIDYSDEQSEDVEQGPYQMRSMNVEFQRIRSRDDRNDVRDGPFTRPTPPATPRSRSSSSARSSGLSSARRNTISQLSPPRPNSPAFDSSKSTTSTEPPQQNRPSKTVPAPASKQTPKRAPTFQLLSSSESSMSEVSQSSKRTREDEDQDEIVLEPRYF